MSYRIPSKPVKNLFIGTRTIYEETLSFKNEFPEEITFKKEEEVLITVNEIDEKQFEGYTKKDIDELYKISNRTVLEWRIRDFNKFLKGIL